MSQLEDTDHIHSHSIQAPTTTTTTTAMQAVIPTPSSVHPSDLNSATIHTGDISSHGTSNTVNPMSSTVDTGPVQAYAKLESDTFCYYIRTLQVMLGRRAGSADDVDIHLGSTKGISRQHARLFYNFLNQRFELIVYGKNGAFVNEQFIEKGSTVPLEHRTKVQIGETTFHFLLPKMELEEATHENYPYLTGADEYHSAMTQTTHPLQGQQSAQANPLQSAVAQPQAQMRPDPSVQTTHSHQPSDIRHNPTTGAAGGNAQNSMTTENEQADGTQGTSGETFDTSEYNNKDVKPPFSYASLIAQAINTNPNKKLTLNGIYNYITSHYPYYQMAQNGWQNSIRHNLSLNKAFIKVPRGDNEPGKGAFWTIDASCEGQFRNGVYRKSRRQPQPSAKVGGSGGPVRTKASSAASSSPYDSADANRRRSTSSSKGAASAAAGTATAGSSVATRNDRPAAGPAIVQAGQSDAPTGATMKPTAKTAPSASLLGGASLSRDASSPGVLPAAYNSSPIPNSSTAAATAPQISSSYTPSSYITSSNNTLPVSNAATTASTSFSPALQLLTAAALSSSALTTPATHNTTTPSLPQPSAAPTTTTATTTPIPSSDGPKRVTETSESTNLTRGSNAAASSVPSLDLQTKPSTTPP